MLLNKIPGRAYLLIGVIIFAIANSVTRRLTEIGAENLIDGRNPISFCNVLFVGNLCALITLVGIYHQQLKSSIIRQLSLSDWVNLIGIATLSGALAPALIFIALEKTAVNNVILIGRIEPPLALALSVIFLQARVNKWVIAGAVVSFIGVVLTVFLGSKAELEIDGGELMVAGGAIAAAIAGILSKVSLQQVPFGLFNVIRTAIATVVFFIAAMKLFGPEHFMDVFAPLIWQLMLFYSVIIVVTGQLCWFAGISRTTASEISFANSFNPLVGIIAAYFILGEAPTLAQYLGGLVILVGIVLNQVGIVQQNKESTPSHLEIESNSGFRGI